MKRFSALLPAIAVALLLFPSPSSASSWHRERMTWYGPGFYSTPGHPNYTACGQKMTSPMGPGAGLRGAAHLTLPCGSHITICVGRRAARRCVHTRVVDRGPYGVSWHLDLTAQTDIDLVGRPAHTIERGRWRTGW